MTTFSSAPAPALSRLGDLTASGWRSRSIKTEMRDNLMAALRSGSNPFPDVLGYEDSVLPQLQAAVLARHNVLLLGLRGQAKTRLARLLTRLLDEWMPALADTELMEDPLSPITRQGQEAVADQGPDAPIRWVHRSERYTEKLATPDVSVADLIGDLDPIKAANLRLTYADERVIHFGLVPRAHRGLFVINELPDLQPRIQVALFNILQEGDLQIRGFKLRLQPDIQFVFTANPEDYTNRGSIVTPLKDRIEAQILTHYPQSLAVAAAITRQEAHLDPLQAQTVHVPELLRNLVEEVAFVARESDLVDQKSGVSARLSIAAHELLVAQAERRMLLNAEPTTTARLGDLYGAVPAITGKVELVYEGEQEGPLNVALTLISKAIRKQFVLAFPDPEALKKKKQESPYDQIVDWFNQGNSLDLLRDAPHAEYERLLGGVPGLRELVSQRLTGLSPEEELLMMEFVLHGLAECSQLNKHRLEYAISFRDMLGGLFGKLRFGTAADDDEEDTDGDDR